MVLVLVAYLSNKNLQSAIMIALGFTLVLSVANTQQVEEDFEEHFKNNYSNIVDIFYGQFVSKVMSVEDNSDSSNSYEPFCYLTLPIPEKNSVNIYDCLKQFCKTENMKGKP